MEQAELADLALEDLGDPADSAEVHLVPVVSAARSRAEAVLVDLAVPVEEYLCRRRETLLSMR